MHRREALANLTEVAKGLLGFVQRGELASLLLMEPREQRPNRQTQKRLSLDEVERLVADYQTGEGSIYDLADRYGVHRNTVSAQLKARGLVLGFQPLSAAERQRARELRSQNFSFTAIGRVMGRDPKTVKAALAVDR